VTNTSAGWIVRSAVPDTDAQPCLDIYAPFVRDTAVSFEEAAPTLEEFRDRISSIVASHAWLVLEIDRHIVGYAYASPHRARASYRWAVDVTVYIDPEHHGIGIGRRLYGELLERLRNQGFHVACAGVALPNDASVGLHRAMGFEPVGVYKRIGWKAGSWHDVMWLEMELTPAGDSAPEEPRRGE